MGGSHVIHRYRLLHAELRIMLNTIISFLPQWSRLARTSSASQRDRWSRVDSFLHDWGARAAIAAAFIPPGSSVIDLGCGQMQLRGHLPDGCSYHAADMRKWTDEVHEINLDAGLFPPGSYDCAALLGVMEYLHRPDLVLHWARERCGQLVMSYVHPGPSATQEQRAKNGWVNNFSETQLVSLLGSAGWCIDAQQVWREGMKSRHVVYSC